jgi:cystine transport system permease protein
MTMDEVMRISRLMMDSFWPLLKAGLLTTVPLTVISFGLGLIVAFLVALMRLSNIKPLSALAAFYVWVIRGTPLIVQLFIIFYGLPKIGIVYSPFVSAILGLTISQGAYNSEVIRAALLSISKGQWEATKSLGMNKRMTLAYIIVPQAALVAVPSLGNSFISLLKDTSLVATLTVAEVFQIGQQIVAVTYEPLWLYIEVGFIYLLFSTALTYLQAYMEVRLGKHIVAQKS